MRFEGKCMQCFLLEDGIAELRLDLAEDSVNKFNRATLAELAEVVALLQARGRAARAAGDQRQGLLRGGRRRHRIPGATSRCPRNS